MSLTLCSLLLAASLVGPPAPPTPQDVAAEHSRILRGTAVDTAVLVVGAGFDLASTEWALSQCANCREGNPLGQTVERRVALKVATTAAVVVVCHRLRKGGHHRSATTLRWIAFGIQLAAATNNAIRAQP